MPSGRTHDRITFWGLPPLVGLTFLVSSNGGLTLMVAGAYLFSGLMFGPDLDIHSVQYKRWGIIRGIWLPYRFVFKHRSFFSHGFLIGTILRLFYLVTIVMVAAIIGVAISQLIWGFDWNWQQFSRRLLSLITTKYPQEAIAVIIGLELGAMSHAISDYLGSAWKRSQKKPQNRNSRKRTKKLGKRVNRRQRN